MTARNILGVIYEYLISQFAASAGKKAGSFTLYRGVSEILSRIVMGRKESASSSPCTTPRYGFGLFYC